jgi:acetoin utilization deacetylase AcuC-like enzyme
LTPESPSGAILDVILATDSACRKHDAGPGHPEQPARYDAVLAALKAGGLFRSE